MFKWIGEYLYKKTIMKNNSFILLKEEKERIKKLYEATTASASGSYNQPMGFSVPGLGGDVEVIDMETTFIDGDNIEDGSVEINLDIEDIEELLNVNEDERMRKLHRTNSVIEEQIMDVEISPECLMCGVKSLKGERTTPFGNMGTYDYTDEAEEILAAIIKGMGGKEPSVEDVANILMKLVMIQPTDIGFISYNLYENGCLDKCLGDIPG
jgi:hypothetical protein